MLDHTGEVLEVSVGFWRFVLDRTYRRRKLAEWREENRITGGRLAIAVEIVVGVVIGLGLPAAIAFIVATAQ